MRDDFRNIQPEESVRINLSQPHEITYWTCRLNITESELKKVVEKAGTSAKDVERYVRNRNLGRKTIL